MDPHFLDQIPDAPPSNKCKVGFFKMEPTVGAPRLETAVMTHSSVIVANVYYTYEDAKKLNGQWWSEWALSPDLPLPPKS